jgi:hypothetical protein
MLWKGCTLVNLTRKNGFYLFYVALISLLLPMSAQAAVLRSVQSGTATIANGSSSVTATISSVDTTKAFLVFGASLGSDVTADPINSQASGQLAGATSVTFERIGTTGTITIHWYVAEFNNNVSVQRGSDSMPTVTSDNVTLSSVNTAKSFVIVSMRTSGATYDANDFVKAKLTSSTNLALDLQGSSMSDTVVEWQVIEYTDATVQTGDISFLAADSSKTATVTAIDTSKSWLVYSYNSAAGTAADIGQKLVRGSIGSSTSLSFSRDNTGQAISLTWYLIAFTDETTVQQGTKSFTTVDTSLNAAIGTVDLTRSIAAGGLFGRGGDTSYAADDQPAVGSYRLNLNSASNLQITRGITGSIASDVTWFVLQFGTAKRFSYMKSITVQPGQVISGPHTNFPFLFSRTDGDLRSTANGGHVTSDNGYDIIFRANDDTTCGGAGTAPCTLSHEIEKYSASTGQLIAWVKIPSINNGTVFYLYYGNADIVTSQEDPANVWDANYAGVWHLSDNASNTTVADSTGKVNTGTSTANTSSKATAAAIGNGLNFNGTNDYVYSSDSYANPTQVTLSAWVDTSSAAGHKVVGFESSRTGNYSASYDRQIWIGTNGKAYAGYYGTAIHTAVSTNTVNNGNWHYIVGVINDSGNIVRIYVDGALNQSTNGGENPENTTGYFRMGSYKLSDWTNGTDGFFAGIIDEVRVSTSIRSAGWIATEYNNQNAPAGFCAVGAEGASIFTAVTLNHFTATELDGKVLLKWNTGYEVDNLGFRIYREQSGEISLVNPSIIAGSALFTGQRVELTAGRSYSWWDPVALQGPTQYYLEDIDLHGKHTRYGPVTPSAGNGTKPSEARATLLVELNARAQTGAQAQRQTPVVAHSNADAGLAQAGAMVRAASVASSSFTKQQQIAALPAIKIAVRKAGWYRVRQDEILAAGMSPAVDPRTLQLFADGIELPMVVRGEAKGTFVDGDYIEFYGTGLDTPWTDTKIYWLVQGSIPGKRVARVMGPRDLEFYAGGTGQPELGYGGRAGGFESGQIASYRAFNDLPWANARIYWLVQASIPERPTAHVDVSSIPDRSTGFPCTLELKERSIHFGALQTQDGNSFFGAVIAGDSVEQMLNVPHIAPDSPVDADLEISLQGVTTQRHLVRITLNGSDLGIMSFDSRDRAAARFSFPHSLLKSGSNTVGLRSVNGDGDVSLVDTIRLTYWHSYIADDDRLWLRPPARQSILLDGFHSPVIRVMEIASDAATEIRGDVVRTDMGYGIVVTIPDTENATIFAFSDARLESPAEVTANEVSKWSQEGPGADVVIISHPIFLDSTRSLAVQQRAEGFSVTVVNLEDIYDEFAFGAKTPYAIRDFLSITQNRWALAPRYLLLMGDATFDPRNYLGFGDCDFVPTKLVPTTSLEAASDEWFVDFSDDNQPRIAVGRLPARTMQEADAMIAKIIKYRKTSKSDSWNRRALLVADENDSFEFEKAARLSAAQLPPDTTITEIFRDERNDATTRAALLSVLNDGNLIVDYFGHGSVATWRGDILTAQDAYGLTNGNQLSFLISMECLNGFFHDVFGESLGESFLKAPGGGAFAVWASSGMSDPSGQSVMGERLHRIMLEDGITLGEAILRAKASIGDPDIRRSWVFLGDPTVRSPLAGTNAPPVISQMSPTSIIAGSPSFKLTINGIRFLPSSIVRWNGTNCDTVYISSTEIVASIGADDIASPGIAAITVVNPISGETISASMSFSVEAAAPIVTATSPEYLYISRHASSLVVRGQNFLNTSVVLWNQDILPTIFVSSSQLRVTVPASATKSSGCVTLTVVNPVSLGGMGSPHSVEIRKSPTTTTVNNLMIKFDPSYSIVRLSAVIAGSIIDPGYITFQLKDGDREIWIPVMVFSTDGRAAANYPLPLGLEVRNYTIAATYSGGPSAQESRGTGTLMITDRTASDLFMSLKPESFGFQVSSGAGSTVDGYGLIVSTTPISPAGGAIISYANSAGILVGEAAIPLVGALTAARMIVDASYMSETSMALVNPGNAPIEVLADFRNVAGTVVKSIPISLGPAGSTLIPMGSMIAGSVNPLVGTITLSAQSGTFAASSLHTVTNAHGEGILTASQAYDLHASPTGPSVVIPQLMDGGGNSTQIYLVNSSSAEASIGRIDLFDNGGYPLRIDFGGGAGPQSTVEFILPPDGMAKMSSLGTGASRTGFAVVTVSSGSLPFGSAVLQTRQGSELMAQYEVTNPTLTDSMRMYVEVASTPLPRNTGVALVNPGSTAVEVAFKLVGPDGRMHANSILLGPRARLAKLVTELFPDLSDGDFNGALDVRSSLPVAPLALRMSVNQRGEIISSPLPVADLSAPSSGQWILPRFMDGGDFRTQFIAVNPTSIDGEVILNLFNDSGNRIERRVFLSFR